MFEKMLNFALHFYCHRQQGFWVPTHNLWLFWWEGVLFKFDIYEVITNEKILDMDGIDACNYVLGI